MQRAGALRYTGPPRLGPLLNRPRGDKYSKQGKPSQANRGPKNLGRSPFRLFGQPATGERTLAVYGCSYTYGLAISANVLFSEKL